MINLLHAVKCLHIHFFSIADVQITWICQQIAAAKSNVHPASLRGAPLHR